MGKYILMLMKNRYKRANIRKRRPLSVQMRHRLHEGFFLVLVALAIFLLISLLSYHTEDPGWSSSGLVNQVANGGGRVGAFTADIFLCLFGVVAYIFPFLILLSGWLNLQEGIDAPKKPREWVFKLIGWAILIPSACGLVSFYVQANMHFPAASGGMLGGVVSHLLSRILNKTGTTLLFLTSLLCGITLLTGLSWVSLTARLSDYMVRGIRLLKWPRKSIIKARTISDPEPKLSPIIHVTPKPLPPKIEMREKKKFEVDSKIKLAAGELPPLSLLNTPVTQNPKAFAEINLSELSQLVEQRLADFGVTATVVAVHPGPVITRFELDLAPGVKVSKITGLAKDIARALSVVSVRVVEVIPGKSVIGLEIPNENREVVSLRDILESQRYTQSRSPLSLVLGKDISGQAVVVDLAKMPHLLVAGTTGSGKSVGLNAMLLSMLYKAQPEDLRFILIDPKMLELSVYDGIPHLLTPVITDMKDAANALRWCVAEMDKRYKLMAALGVRNIASYNQKIQEAGQKGEPLLTPQALVTDEASAKTALQTLPMIVVIADEFADMMMVVGKKVEDLIARIAQKARAAGIHLILATQRPSVDVITGLIKANIPTRVSFQVSSRIDSRTVLDQQGAEQLLGHGDMLYLPPGAGIPTRVHGAYVADEEVHRVVAAWRSVGEPEYIDEVTSTSDEGCGGVEAGEVDALYDDAVRIVTESRRASISLVQRRLRIGYNRAARIMEEMENAGVVSSMDNSGAREVLAAPVVD